MNDSNYEEWDWTKIEQKLYNPAFVPDLKSDSDVRYFSRIYTSLNPHIKGGSCNGSIIANGSKADYTGFTYMGKSLL